jgi:aminopeptidase N
MKGLLIHFCVLAALTLAMSGCAVLIASAPKAPSQNKPQSFEPGQVLVWNQPEPIGPDQLKKALAKIDVAIVGETHDHPGHHEAQLKILKIMTEQGPAPVVGIEWLDHQAQAASDELSKGSISVDDFAKKADWKTRWGYNLNLYRPILEYIREHRLNLRALNAPLKVIRKVARKGLKSLTPEERALLAPSLDMDDPEYEEMLARQFQGHGVQGKEAQANFMAAQIGRDETMAHNLAQALYPWPDGAKRAVVLAGSAHLAHGRGLPPRIGRRLPGVKLITILPVSSDKLKKALKDGQDGQGPADYLMVTSPAPPRPPRLGVMIRPVEGGLLIEGIWPQGAAFKAGIKKGDIMKSVDGKPLKTPKDIHDAIKAAPYESHRYMITRGDKEMVLEITLADPREARPEHPRE